MRKTDLAFTLIETLLVVVIVGLLSSVAVIKLGKIYSDGIADKARVDLDLLNKAIREWRSDNPSLNFETEVSTLATSTYTGNLAKAAFATIQPYMSLPANVTDLNTFNQGTRSRWLYGYRGMYHLGTSEVEGTLVRLDCTPVSDWTTQKTQPLVVGWASGTAQVCTLTPMPTFSSYLFYAVSVN